MVHWSLHVFEVLGRTCLLSGSYLNLDSVISRYSKRSDSNICHLKKLVTKLHFLKFIKPTWQESWVPFPAQTMLLVILEALYFIFRHSDRDRMGTFTCCATEARFPPSEVLPHPTTVPVFPEKSLSVGGKIFLKV